MGCEQAFFRADPLKNKNQRQNQNWGREPTGKDQRDSGGGQDQTQVQGMANTGVDPMPNQSMIGLQGYVCAEILAQRLEGGQAHRNSDTAEQQADVTPVFMFERQDLSPVGKRQEP